VIEHGLRTGISKASGCRIEVPTLTKEVLHSSWFVND